MGARPAVTETAERVDPPKRPRGSAIRASRPFSSQSGGFFACICAIPTAQSA